MDEIFVTECTGSCHDDNFQATLWRKFPLEPKCHPFDEIFIIVCTGSDQIHGK